MRSEPTGHWDLSGRMFVLTFAVAFGSSSGSFSPSLPLTA